ncbi:hypothetical protein KQX54_015981 [Cotesia glomerata]|uniref:Uncharacterized protein n=1 Tax=Cotesia glomerata TaxID=32391 RepID=A0AAV7ISF3_COTGL|nr:hypothetical protein KQX54_015981 [Cotesia glomerata]
MGKMTIGDTKKKFVGKAAVEGSWTLRKNRRTWDLDRENKGRLTLFYPFSASSIICQMLLERFLDIANTSLPLENVIWIRDGDT